MIFSKTYEQVARAVALLVLAFFVLKCSHPDAVQPAAGKVSFSVGGQSSAGGRVAETETPAFVRYLVENEAGEETADTVALYAFGDGYVSEKQEFAIGTYTLQEYYILNDEHRVLYAAVKAGAPLAPLVNQPLPFAFVVEEGETTNVSPEVLPVTDESSPSDFGYVKWSFQVAADFVKFFLPVHSSLIPHINTATLIIRQGNYADTTLFKGNASVSLYAKTLVKKDTPVEITVVVESDDVFIDRLPFNPNMGDDVLYNTSKSQFVFKRTINSIDCQQFIIPEFRHKLGHGWDFDFAEITSVGRNDAWFKIRYQGGEYCNPHVQITTNASVFGDQTYVDKIVWTGFDESAHWQGISNFFGSPACLNGICTLSADLSDVWPEDYQEFADACASNEWLMFDSEARVTTFMAGDKGFLTTYFKVEKDTTLSSATGRIGNTPNASKMVREDLLKE